jgi:hypothetical protein
MDFTVTRRCYKCYCCDQVFLRKKWLGDFVEVYKDGCTYLVYHPCCPSCSKYELNYCLTCHEYLEDDRTCAQECGCDLNPGQTRRVKKSEESLRLHNVQLNF